MRCRLPTALCCAALLVGCHETPTEPDSGVPTLAVYCQPTGHEVSCTAVLFNARSGPSSRDVTLTAVWLATDTSLGSYSAPGLFTAAGHGEVGLWARYGQYEALTQAWFLVDPGTDARWLYWLSGLVRDDETNEGISGAEVKLLDGYAAGRTAFTNSVGHYQLERVLTDESFSAVASKPGYETSVKTYSVSPPVGLNGNPPFLDFRLRRTAAVASP